MMQANRPSFHDVTGLRPGTVEIPDHVIKKGKKKKHKPGKYSIFCCGCQTKVSPRLTDGKEIYPHRPDLYERPYWKCDECCNYVGCHHKTKFRTRPMGNIATPEIRRARRHIHKILDPLWRSGDHNRSELYARISREVGWEYHTGMIRSIEEARKIYALVKNIAEEGETV